MKTAKTVIAISVKILSTRSRLSDLSDLQTARLLLLEAVSVLTPVN